LDSWNIFQTNLHTKLYFTKLDILKDPNGNYHPIYIYIYFSHKKWPKIKQFKKIKIRPQIIWRVIWTKNIFWTKYNFLDQNYFFGPKLFFEPKLFFGPELFFSTKITFWTKNIINQKFWSRTLPISVITQHSGFFFSHPKIDNLSFLANHRKKRVKISKCTFCPWEPGQVIILFFFRDYKLAMARAQPVQYICAQFVT